MNNFSENREKTLKKLKSLDEAYVNSILSQAVYSYREWSISELDRDIYSMGPRLVEAISDKRDMATFKIWNFLKTNVKPVLAGSVNLSETSEGKVFVAKNKDYFFDTKFTYKNGFYSAGRKNEDIARAALLTTDDPENPGKKILHVVFRGTEFPRIKEFFSKAYLDMHAYYYQFKPLEDMVRKYINNPDNNISQIHATGHSLGGAMAEEFLKNMPDNPEVGYVVKGFTFGSPGSTKRKTTSFLNAGYHAVKKFFTLKEDVKPEDIYNTYSKPKDNVCSNDGTVCNIPKNGKENRLTHYYHSFDPVPIVGVAGYNKNGKEINLTDKIENLSKDVGLIKDSFWDKIPILRHIVAALPAGRFHDSDRYSLNLKNKIETLLHDNKISREEVTKLAPNWRQWIKSEIDFQKIGIKHKATIEEALLAKNPTLKDNPESLIEAVYNVRENMKHDNTAIILANQLGLQDKGTHHLVSNDLSNTEQAEIVKGRFGHSFGPESGDPAQRLARVANLRKAVEEDMEKRRIKMKLA